MNEGMLEDYLDRDVRVHFAPHDDFAGTSSFEEGRLYDYSEDGILLEMTDGSLAYIPISSIRMVTIKPKQGFWARLTRPS